MTNLAAAVQLQPTNEQMKQKVIVLELVVYPVHLQSSSVAAKSLQEIRKEVFFKYSSTGSLVPHQSSAHFQALHFRISSIGC